MLIRNMSKYMIGLWGELWLKFKSESEHFINILYLTFLSFPRKLNEA